MKKKKLKKKIKKLEKEVERYHNNLSVITRTDISLSSKIRNLNDKIAKLENDNKYYKEWIDTNPSTEDIQRQISELKSKISCHDNRLSVLDARSRVDYTMYSTNKEESNG
jgi:phage shock protein A